MNALTLDPMLVAHSLELADKYLRDTRPLILPKIVPCGPRAWFVVQTISRGEDKAQRALGAVGFTTYQPTMRKEIWRRSKRIVEVRAFPLFNRYVFAELPVDTGQWGIIYDIEEVDCVLGCGGVPRSIPESDVRRFMAAEAACEFDDTSEAKIKRKEIGRNKRETVAMRYPVGSRLRAITGAFGGFSGHVTSISGRGLVKVMIEMLGGLVPVEFPSEMIVPI